MVPMGRQSTQPIVSSSSTLWAQASKEWVIPAKPKPGRKPKKEVPPPPKEPEETDSKGRRVQNRAAQRAFRERKQSQLADLQARVQLYEQGEIERNVALQNVAKRLKEENESLRLDNLALKEEIARLRRNRDDGYDNDRKRWRDDGHSLKPLSLEPHTRKRLRTGTESPAPPSHMPQAMSYLPSSPSMASSPDSNAGSNNAYSPISFPPPSRAQSVFPTAGPPSSGLSSYSLAPKQFDLGNFDCGLCNDNTPCVCREIAMQQVTSALANHETGTLKIEGVEQNTRIAAHPLHPGTETQTSATVVTPSSGSILDNLPAYQPAVPLRRNGPSNPLATPIFQIRLPSPGPPRDPSVAPVCSGDPSNCMACADDAFGQAFCSALGDSVCSNSQCVTCPDRANGQTPSRMRSASVTTPIAETHTMISLESSPAPQPSERRSGQTIPTSDAWRQLKSHPNIQFADLSMLADVVARRTKCTGPRVVISPAPGSTTPERNLPIASLPLAKASQPSRDDDQPIILVDPHARYHEQLQALSAPPSPPSLVPQDVLRECGQKRIREVDAAGVREALRLLDVQFGRP